MGKRADQRRGFTRRQDRERPSSSSEQPKEGPRLCARCRQCFALKDSNYCREHRPFWEQSGLIRFVVRVCSAASAILASKIVAHWRVICRVILVVGLVVLVVTGVRVLTGRFLTDFPPVGETPVASPTQTVSSPTKEIPPTETPAAEAEESLTVGPSRGIPDSVIPGGVRTPWDVIAVFNGNDEELAATGADGCPTASRRYMESFYGSSLPLWEEMGAVSEPEVPELPEGVILREGEPIYRLRTLGSEEGWLVLGQATLSSQIACRQTDGARVYINNRSAPNELVWVILWGNGNAAIFRVACGNFALVKGELPPPPTPVPPTETPVPPTETPVPPTPTATPTGTPEPTPTPTEVPPTPTEVPPTPTQEPTATPTSTPVPTSTPRPTATPQPTPTEVPPTPTPVPPTPTPTQGPRPTATPQGD